MTALTTFYAASDEEAAERLAESHDLVTRLQRGDSSVFGLIYERYHQMIYGYVFRRVGHRQLAEDITQEAFVRAMRGLNGFQWRGTDVGAWLVTIARNLVADYYKSGYHNRTILSDDVYAGADTAVDGPEDDVVEYLTNLPLIAGLDQLAAEQRQVLVLRFLRELSVAETATEMGKNIGAVKALQFRAVRALARVAGITRADDR